MKLERCALHLLAITVTVLVTGCSEPRFGKNLIVVLPDESGKVGAVSVNDGNNTVVLDSALAAARVTRANKVETLAVTGEDVGGLFNAALAAQPTPPKRFRLYFVRDSHELTPQSEAEFETVFTDIGARSAYEVQVTGHTDTVGEASYNAWLSIRRAEAIRSRLIDRGIDDAHLEVHGRGEWDLYIKTADEVTEPRNRRVEIVVR